MLCIGHRGAAGHAPENTVLSVETAVAMGADWVEIDVYVVDGELIVIHDPTLERTTNGVGEVMAQPLAALRALDAGQGQQIPLLSEIFAAAAGRVGVNIELKGPETAVPVVQFVQRQLDAGWPLSYILISSFDHNMLRMVHELDPRLRLGALLFPEPLDWLQDAVDMGAYAINPWLPTVTAELVQTAHARGLKVYVWTVNEPAEMARMQALGVDGLFTDYPDRLRQLLDEAG